MPVIGHAFVGIVAAHGFEPGGPRNARLLRPLARTFWTPTLVALAYFPDIVTQLGLTLGFASAKLAGHSMPLGVLAGAVIGIGWARVSGGSARVLIGLAIGSILMHDVLDLLHASDRAPLWPFATDLSGAGWRALPNRLISEVVMYGVPCAAYEAWRYYAREHRLRHRTHSPSQTFTWVARVAVIALVIAAVFIQSSRGYRRRQLNNAERHLRRGEFSQALEAADAADGWPVAARPGRVDLLRGEAYEGLGDLARAEALYLRAYHSDPENFWAIADLAEYYAAHASPAAERRRRTAPYVEQLRQRFGDNEALPAVLDRVERRLARAP